jgi:hypothetical protein
VRALPVAELRGVRPGAAADTRRVLVRAMDGILRVLIRRAQRGRLHHSLTISRGVPQSAGASGREWIVADRPGPVPGSGCGRGAAGSGSPAPSGGTTSTQSARRARGTAGLAGRRSPIPGTRSSSPLHRPRVRVARNLLRRTPFGQTSEMITDNPVDSSGCRSGKGSGRQLRSGLDVTGPGRGCNPSDGGFTILRMATDSAPPSGCRRRRAEGRRHGGASRGGTGSPGSSPSRGNRPR